MTRTQWLSRMRWGALLAQAVAILFAQLLLEVPLPISWMWTVVGIGAASNLWLLRRQDDISAIGAFLVLDVLLLTALLYLSGGPTNPFSVIYLVYIALSAVMLSTLWTWSIAALSVASFAWLFYFHLPSPELSHHEHGDFRGHLYGMFVAFVLASLLTAYFVGRLSREVRERERALAEAQERARRWGKLASIATLAAGAAHELGTPLGTIAIAAGEMKRRLQAEQASDALLSDADLIREEVQRCRAVLDQMSLAGGEPSGEAPTAIPVEELFESVRERLSPEQAARWKTSSEIRSLRAPRQALVQMVENLVRNGFDACAEGRVALEVSERDGAVELVFTDEGHGMDAETLARATEPFFTTKGLDDRMGLGLFLANALVDSLEGTLSIESVPAQGSTLRVILPQLRA